MKPSAADYELLHLYLDNGLTPVDREAVEARLLSDPGLLDRLSLAAVDEGVVAEWAQTQAALSIGPAAQLAADRQSTTAQAAPPPMAPRAFLVLATAAAVGAVLLALPARDSQASFAVLDRQAKARFSDNGVRPHEGDRLKAGEQFTLVNGFIELRYRNGVQCVVEAPSTFQVPAGDRLDLLVGAVSVSVPPGAEGFQVHGPSGVVTDLGTRMAVHVGEAGDTSLHVVEGKAKLRASGVLDHEAILVEGAAATAFSASSSPEAVPHDATRFRTRLPDRLVSYACTKATGDGEIASLLVQRGGREIRYSADQLIVATVTSFNCTAGVLASGGYVVGAEDRSAAIGAATGEDFSLITGVINAGGPATQHGTPNHPVEVTDITPGITFAFPHPVVNLDGPDLVVFDIQSAVQDSRGDAFIIRPTILTDPLRCHNVEAYDITYDSPYALRLPAFYQHLFDDPVRSLDDIRTAEGKSMLAEVAFKALAVAVDLSDLGYPIGARVGEVFLQDVGDDSAEVDPVLVAGFPSDGGV